MAHMKDELLTLYRNFGTPWNTPMRPGCVTARTLNAISFT